MSWNRIALLLLASALLTACGGGDNAEDSYEDKVSTPYGVIFSVNGVQDATAITIKQTELDSDNNYSENCDTDSASNSDTSDDLTDQEKAEFCDNKRTVGAVAFQFRFINNLLEPLPFSYTGVGVTIQIERLTSSSPETWETVWDSDAYVETQYRLYDLPNYDQNALASTTLGPALSYPNQDFSALSFTFLTDRNFTDDNANGRYDQTADRLVALPGTVADADQDEGSSKCAWLPVKNTTTTKYDKPLCQTEKLSTGTYRATIHYNFVFNGSVADPAPVIITVNPVS